MRFHWRRRQGSPRASSAHSSDPQHTAPVVVAVPGQGRGDVAFGRELDVGNASSSPALVPGQVNLHDAPPAEAPPEVIVGRGRREVGHDYGAGGWGLVPPPRTIPSERQHVTRRQGRWQSAGHIGRRDPRRSCPYAGHGEVCRRRKDRPARRVSAAGRVAVYGHTVCVVFGILHWGRAAPPRHAIHRSSVTSLCGGAGRQADSACGRKDGGIRARQAGLLREDHGRSRPGVGSGEASIMSGPGTISVCRWRGEWPRGRCGSAAPHRAGCRAPRGPARRSARRDGGVAARWRAGGTCLRHTELLREDHGRSRSHMVRTEASIVHPVGVFSRTGPGGRQRSLQRHTRRSWVAVVDSVCQGKLAEAWVAQEPWLRWRPGGSGPRARGSARTYREQGGPASVSGLAARQRGIVRVSVGRVRRPARV